MICCALGIALRSTETMTQLITTRHPFYLGKKPKVIISCCLEATEGLYIKYRCAHLYEGKNLRRNGLPFSTPGDFPYPGIESTSLASLALTGRFFTTTATWENQYTDMIIYLSNCESIRYSFSHLFNK